MEIKDILFYSILFYSILFYSILFYSMWLSCLDTFAYLFLQDFLNYLVFQCFDYNKGYHRDASFALN